MFISKSHLIGFVGFLGVLFALSIPQSAHAFPCSFSGDPGDINSFYPCPGGFANVPDPIYVGEPITIAASVGFSPPATGILFVSWSTIGPAFTQTAQGDYFVSGVFTQPGLAIWQATVVDNIGGSGLICPCEGGASEIEFSVLPNSVAPVPEPSTWAMMLIGFAVIGLRSYRRQSRGQIAGPANIGSAADANAIGTFNRCL
jgi:hypothetical protein